MINENKAGQGEAWKCSGCDATSGSSCNANGCFENERGAPPASADCEFHGSDKAACEQYSGRNPCASADAVSVPRNIALRMAADAAQYDHEHAVVNDNVQLWQQPNARLSLTVGDLRTVRALLAQDQEVKS